MNFMLTINQKPIIDILKTKRKEHKYNTKVIKQQGKRLKEKKKQKITTPDIGTLFAINIYFTRNTFLNAFFGWRLKGYIFSRNL